MIVLKLRSVTISIIWHNHHNNPSHQFSSNNNQSTFQNTCHISRLLLPKRRFFLSNDFNCQNFLFKKLSTFSSYKKNPWKGKEWNQWVSKVLHHTGGLCCQINYSIEYCCFAIKFFLICQVMSILINFKPINSTVTMQLCFGEH